MTYKEKLKHPKWQKKRLEILERDKYRCQRCFDKEHMLVVHHKWYDKNTMPWEYEDECYVTLCEDCHSAFHTYFEGKMDSDKYFIYKFNSINETDIFLFTSHLSRLVDESSNIEFSEMISEFKNRLIQYIDN